MRQHLFRGKRIDKDEWVEGYLNYNNTRQQYYIMDDVNAFPIPVYEESVGMYTDMKEFVVTDRSFNKPLFEGDIVEVWSRRRLPTEYTYSPASSQYDIQVKARAVICFKYGKWFLDYDNDYNKALCKLRGNEQYERTVDSYTSLYDFRCHSNDEEWYREHNSHYKWHDIVKIGNVFENADLLEG